MAEPDYLICLDCESPTYTFEWRDGKPVDIICDACANEDPEQFMTEGDLEALAEETPPPE